MVQTIGIVVVSLSFIPLARLYALHSLYCQGAKGLDIGCPGSGDDEDEAEDDVSAAEVQNEEVNQADEELAEKPMQAYATL